jgi:hypothetical protein
MFAQRSIPATMNGLRRPASVSKAEHRWISACSASRPEDAKMPFLHTEGSSSWPRTRTPGITVGNDGRGFLDKRYHSRNAACTRLLRGC